MKIKSRINHSVFLALACCCILSSCYERQEGCLNSNATNFNVYADDDCCCDFPNLRINTIRMHGDETFDASDIYTNALGQEYMIEAQSFIMSDITLGFSDGTFTSLEETLDVELPLGSGNDMTLEDNFGLIQAFTPSVTPGTISEVGQISELSFVIGLNDQADLLDPSQVDATHPLGLNNAPIQFVTDVGYTFIRWVIQPQNVPNVEEITVLLRGTDIRRNITLDVDALSSAGDDTILTVAIDYEMWLAGIDFAADQSTIEAQIRDNTINVFSIVP